MYLSVIGKSLVRAYNEKYRTNYTVRTFFDEVYHPLFFGDDKYLMWATNSPFVQGKSAKSTWDKSKIELTRHEFHQKIASGASDASVALGNAASEEKEFGTTSGQVSDLTIPNNLEDIYASWLGASCGLGVQGGYSLVFDNDQLLLATFLGWKTYRKFLSDPAVFDKFPTNKITSWNGQWMSFRMSTQFQEDPSLSRFEKYLSIDKLKGTYAIPTAGWVNLVFGLTKFTDAVNLNAYVFGLGQTNKTIGFIPVRLTATKRLRATYENIFYAGEHKISSIDIEKIYGQHIKRACELGSIGLQAMQPQNLQKYFGANAQSYQLAKPKISRKASESDEEFASRTTKLKNKDRNQLAEFFAFKTWIITMLNRNKKEVSDICRRFAQNLVEYRKSAKKNDRKNLIQEDLLGATNQRGFLSALSQLASDSSVGDDMVEAANEMRDAAHFTSSADFNYFIALLKFDYAYQDRQQR